MLSAWIARLIELPLLAKELNEQAAQRRTYIVRFAYASLLFAAACGLFYGNFLHGERSSSAGLGQGRRMFEDLVWLQFWSIYLLLPAVSCGCLTIEKERNSLGLLLITSLGPWQIVMQKLLGRVVPMLTFILLSFPLMAVAYSFGGITEDYLWAGIVLLVLACFQAAALSVMCSAWYPTTVEAFVANYFLFLVLYFVVPFGWGTWLFREASDASLAVTLVRSIFSVFLTAGFVLAARLFLVARAFVPPKNALLALFHKLDAGFNRANNNRFTRGVILVKDGDPLPGAEPVAWRETSKRSLGTFRYLFRVLVVLELPLLAVCHSLQAGIPGGPNVSHISKFLYVLWGLAGAMIVVHAGSVIASERTRQTLDVLLTTPLSGAEILTQKLQGVRRLIHVLLVPFVTIFAFETWWYQRSNFRWLALALSLASLTIYLPVLEWLALWIGLKVRSQIKVVLGTMTLVAGWLAVPALVRAVVVQIAGTAVPMWADCLLALWPSEQIAAIEGINPAASSARKAMEAGQLAAFLGLLAMNFLLYGVAGRYLRRMCLRNADQLLGRLAPPAGEQPQPVAAIVAEGAVAEPA
jgi:ABC-type transport system involved in multi-copper enzyme maturation permease subunit